MATVDECERALHEVAARLAASDEARRRADYERTLSCTLRDLDVVFTGRLQRGELIDIELGATADAQVRVDLTSDDLVRLVDGSLPLATALATGRLRVGAGIRDLLRLRAVF